MKNIYLDMDGVIADFDKRYQELFKITTKEAERDKKWIQFFDKFIQDRHFATLDLMPEAIELMDYLKTQAPFWKKEQTPDGAHWVDARVTDDAALARWGIVASNA